LNKKSYPWIDYVEAICIAAGVALFTFAEKSSSGDAANDTFFGAFLLATYLLADSFTSQWQSKVFKSYEIDQFQMMLGTNIWATLIVGAQLLQSGEGWTSITFLLTEPKALFHMILLSITSATGQLFIFYTIKEFGPVIFTIMMTTRQILSLFLSCLLFNHPMHGLGWVGSLTVFVIVFYRIYRKGSD
jgi:solute carrier family 35 (adenosine 3'-phospho 5'-phosphosulfate transporter), member B2